MSDEKSEESSEGESIDKSAWGPGPWQEEPDRLQWQDELTGFPCLVKRHPLFGHLCGYVGIPQGHPLHGKSFQYEVKVSEGEKREVNLDKAGVIALFLHALQGEDDDRYSLDTSIEVHGGLTYSSRSVEGPEGEKIRHIPEAGDEHGIWWFGFDCGHCMDRAPAVPTHLQVIRNQKYRDLAYVKEECRRLAEQLIWRSDEKSTEWPVTLRARSNRKSP